MRAKRRDTNHREIINEFKRLGWSVLDIADLKNCCDIFVSKNDITVAIEIKDGKKSPSQRKLTPGEKAFSESWKGHWELIKSIEEVQNLNDIARV